MEIGLNLVSGDMFGPGLTNSRLRSPNQSKAQGKVFANLSGLGIPVMNTSLEAAMHLQPTLADSSRQELRPCDTGGGQNPGARTPPPDLSSTMQCLQGGSGDTSLGFRVAIWREEYV